MHASLQELSRAAAEYICGIAREAVRKRNIFTFVLSGGSTPRLLYKELAGRAIAKKIDWRDTHIFWGDERCVEPDHPDSNYALAFQTLLSKVDILPANVHRIPTEGCSADTAAEAYEKTLRHFFLPPAKCENGRYFPSFDLILLGLGQDGHTASLFPGDAALEEGYRWVVAVDGKSGSPPLPRMTLTFPAINKARCVIFLASGSAKREVFQEIIRNPDKAPYPAARVRPAGRLLWFIDEWLA